MSLLFALASLALAAPDVMVVGVHVPGLVGDAPMAAGDRVAAALEETGKVDALAPVEASRRMSGRESLVLQQFGLGPGKERLAEGRILYERAQVDQAIPVLREAADRLAAGLAYAPDARDLQDALVLLGMAHVGLGDESAARAAFARAVTLDPARELDPVNHPPRVVELYGRVRGEVAGQPPATLVVRASAAGRVYLDGREIGQAPVEHAAIPGEHHVLVRAAGGASRFETLRLAPGERREIDALLEQRGLGTPAAEANGRARETRELYRAVGAYGDRAVIVLAGMTAPDKVGVQLYSPVSGNFSRALVSDAGDDPVSAICELAPAVVGYLAENGDVRADRVSAQVLPLDISSNDLLARLLFDPPRDAPAPPPPVAAKGGGKWWIWAGVGALAAGGAATAVVLVTQDDGAAPDAATDPDQGTVTFGPIP